MNPTSKKFVSLFLIFSLVMLSANLYAKERRGAKLTITKKDGQQIEGELITVKPKSLLLLNSDGKDVSVGITDIKVIRVVKKSKFWTGAGAGIIIFGGGTALSIAIFGTWESDEVLDVALFGGAIGAAAGLLIGGVTGALLGTDKTIQIEGMTDLEIRETLEKLRKKARIRDYK
ncbi:hypothetical protein ES703_45737 [subsurface metagenome]